LQESADLFNLAIFTPVISPSADLLTLLHLNGAFFNNITVFCGSYEGKKLENIKIIPYSTDPFVRYSPENEILILDLMIENRITHIFCDYAFASSQIVELNARKLKLPVFIQYYPYDGILIKQNNRISEYLKWMAQNVTLIFTLSEPMSGQLIDLGIAPYKIHTLAPGQEYFKLLQPEYKNNQQIRQNAINGLKLVIDWQHEIIPALAPPHTPFYLFETLVASAKSQSETEVITRQCFSGIIKNNFLPLDNQPLVSVIICVYNGEKTIRKCIESITGQTYKNWELIIVDDGSIDNTSLIIRDFLPSEKIKYIYQDNKGLNSARNVGIKSSDGKYLKFFDADDILFSFSLEVLVSQLMQQPEDIALIYADYVFHYQDKDTYKYWKMPAVPGDKPGLYRQQLISNIILIGTTLIKKEAVNLTGLFNEHYKAATDFEFFNRLLLHYRITKVEIPTHLYLIHSAQITGNIEKLRIFTDMSCQELLKNIDLNDLFPDLKNKPDFMAEAIQDQSVRMLNRGDTPVDSVINLLKSAQSLVFTDTRQEMLTEVYKINNKKVMRHFHRFLKQPRHIEYKDTVSDSQTLYHKYRLAYHKYLYYKIYLNEKKAEQVNHSVEFFRYPDFFINYKNTGNNRPNYYISSILWDYFSMPERLISHCEKVNELWVINSFMKKSLVNAGINADKIYIIPAGTDTGLFRPDIEPLDIATDKNFRFLCISEFSANKGIYTLIEAYLEEFGADEDVSLVLKYDEPYYLENELKLKNFINSIKSTKAGPEIVFFDRVIAAEQLAGLYKACHCFVYPFRADSLATHIFEAASCGIPVITTDTGDLSDFYASKNLFLTRAELRRNNNVELEEFKLRESICTFYPDKKHLKEQMRFVFENKQNLNGKTSPAGEVVRNHLSTETTLKKITERVTAINSLVLQ
jgi:glycosyltransferase involved in cell wall biosynthesis